MGYYNLAKDYLSGFEKLNCLICGRAFKENDPVFFEDFSRGMATHTACFWEKQEKEEAIHAKNKAALDGFFSKL